MLAVSHFPLTYDRQYDIRPGEQSVDIVQTVSEDENEINFIFL